MIGESYASTYHAHDVGVLRLIAWSSLTNPALLACLFTSFVNLIATFSSIVRPSLSTILSRQYGCRLIPNRPRPLMSICFGPYFSLLTIASADNQHEVLAQGASSLTDHQPLPLHVLQVNRVVPRKHQVGLDPLGRALERELHLQNRLIDRQALYLVREQLELLRRDLVLGRRIYVLPSATSLPAFR